MEKNAGIDYEMEQGTTIECIDIGKIKPDPNQPRKEYDKEKLQYHVDAYKRHGQILPIEIDEKNVIVCGEMRWRTCQLAGIKKIKCIRISKLNKDVRRERQFVENACRQSMTAKDSIAVVKEVLGKVQNDMLRTAAQHTNKHNKAPITTTNGYREVARRLGCSEAWVRDVLKVDEMPAILKEAVTDDKISIRAANQIYESSDNLGEMKEVLAKATEDEEDVWGKDRITQYIKHDLHKHPELEGDKIKIFASIHEFKEFNEKMRWAIEGFKQSKDYEKLTPLELRGMTGEIIEYIETLAIHLDNLLVKQNKRLDVGVLADKIKSKLTVND